MNSILLDTLNHKPTSRPPVWYMRQAGRVLPSYLELKEKHSFWQMMKDPQLGSKVTLLPVQDLGVDAAILFSDILVIPYAMGMGLDFTDNGPVFENPLAAYASPVKLLNPEPEKLNYIYNVIRQIQKDRPENTPLIGFCGAPLTVLCYMLQGLGRKADFPDAVKFFYQNRKETQLLIDAVTELSLVYIDGQIKSGIDVFQLFETHAGLIPLELYNELFWPSIQKIAVFVRSKNIPFIYFPKDFGAGYGQITPEICDFVSVDWHLNIEQVRKIVHPEVGLQGNLDPRALFGSKADIDKKLQAFIPFGKENQNWIFNLGHGFVPGIPYENALFVTEWVKNADWAR